MTPRSDSLSRGLSISYDNPQERPEETTGESAIVTHGWVAHAMFAHLTGSRRA